MHGPEDTPDRAGRTRTRLVKVGMVLGILVLGLVLSRGPLLRYLDARARLEVKQEQVRVLAQRNRDLKQSIQSMSDPATIESLARSEFGYARPGEQVTAVIGIPREKPAPVKPTPKRGPLETLVSSVRALF